MTMDLRDFAVSRSGVPIAGIAVNLRAASFLIPNVGAISQSTITDSNGMWEFTGLADGEYDVDAEYGDEVLLWKGKASYVPLSLSAHIVATAAHGATGAVVGTTNSQVLTNKTLTAPTIADFTNAAHDHGDADDGGALVSGAFPTAPGILTAAMIANQSANLALLGPASGAAAAPTFRAAVAADHYAMPRGEFYHNADQAISSGGSNSDILFNTENQKRDLTHSTSSSTNLVTIVTPGWYDLVFSFYWSGSPASSETGDRFAYILLGSTVIAEDARRAMSGANNETSQTVTRRVQLAASDVLKCQVWQDSGGSQTIAHVASLTPIFTVTWIGP
jgi:hypothetical protein